MLVHCRRLDSSGLEPVTVFAVPVPGPYILHAGAGWFLKLDYKGPVDAGEAVTMILIGFSIMAFPLYAAKGRLGRGRLAAQHNHRARPSRGILPPDHQGQDRVFRVHAGWVAGLQLRGVTDRFIAGKGEDEQEAGWRKRPVVKNGHKSSSWLSGAPHFINLISSERPWNRILFLLFRILLRSCFDTFPDAATGRNFAGLSLETFIIA